MRTFFCPRLSYRIAFVVSLFLALAGLLCSSSTGQAHGQ